MPPRHNAGYFTLALALALALTLALLPLALIDRDGAIAAERPPQPTTSSAPEGCTWRWLTGGGIGIWTEACDLAPGKWRVVWHEAEQRFDLELDGVRTTTVLQIFRKTADAPPSAILPELKSKGLIPNDDDCVLTPASVRPAPRTIAFYDIRPQGERLKIFEATPEDQIPDPPCGDYGWSTHGIRYFQTDIAHKDIVLYVNEGQDGTMFAPQSITFE